MTDETTAPVNTQARLASVPMPLRIARLQRDERGYPIPAFVEFIDNRPDFRIMNGRHLRDCIHHKRCWVCGGPLGRNMTFVVGPMCIVNRTSAEPPSHLECGRYSAQVCPFLAIPHMRRIDAHMPEGATVAGIGIRRNPGVICLWTVRDYKAYKQGRGILFQMGEPTNVEWWSQGRTGTRAEVDESIRTGLPILEAEAAKEQGAPEELQRYITRAQKYLPMEGTQ